MQALSSDQLEQLITLPKSLADPILDVAQLRTRSREDRDELWRRLRDVEHRYQLALETCARDPYLEGYMALAQLKISAAARSLGEPEPQGTIFPMVAFQLLEQLDELCVFERLTPAELVEELEQANGGRARLAAAFGMHLTSDLACDPSIPGTLAFALRRFYRRRIARAQEAARLYVGRHGLSVLVREMHWTCTGCHQLVLDASHVQALSQANIEVLIALAPAEQARLLAELARLKVLQGMDLKKVLAVLAERQPVALEALKELAAGAATAGLLEPYERLLQELKGALSSQQRDYRFTLDKLETIVNSSLDAIKGVAYSLSAGRGTSCPGCGSSKG